MARFKVEIERPLCISCESCVNICPEFWEMAPDGFSHLKGSEKAGKNEEREVDDVSCNIDAAESCRPLASMFMKMEKKSFEIFLCETNYIEANYV